MSDLVSNIEILLENHDFVTVPGFGGFVAEAEGASEAADMLYPPRKALAFNPALTYNDGLLAHEYVKKAGVSFEKANLMIAEAVNELNRKLISGMPVIFGTLGTFRISNGNILFTMSGKGGFLSSSYGLDEVYFPAIAGANVAAMPGQVRTNAAMPAAPAIRPSAAPLRRAELTQSSDLIRNEWGLSKALGMAAAILLLIMLFPVRIQDGNFANYGGQIETLGLVNGDDPTANYVQIPMETTQWSDTFTQDDYKALVKAMYDGEVTVSNDISAMPETTITVNFAGNIK